ncbi:MAG: HD domain-containing phosphohydrolase [Vampirovibrionales bacterium]|nr:HD domain-containing phosphohydrolase [Vampirovibrionales bacterium]
MKVTIEDLAHMQRLDYDLYAASGETIYPAGLALKEIALGDLRGKAMFRNHSEMPKTLTPTSVEQYFDHEGTLLYVANPELTQEERFERILEDAQKPIYGPELAHSFVSSIQYFWDRMAQGATPDIALCEVVAEKMIAETTSHADQINFLSQIRVRDPFTYSHILDVAALSIALAVKIGFSRKEVKEIALASILHDLGKLVIPKNIMFKPSRLSEKEFMVMKLHPELGYKMIVHELKLGSDIARPALEHQEMYGGGGYPQNIKGDEIHPYSHVVKIADVYDALTSKRPYKESIPSSKAIKIMLGEGNKSFHPEYLKHFLELANYDDPALDPAPRWGH